MWHRLMVRRPVQTVERQLQTTPISLSIIRISLSLLDESQQAIITSSSDGGIGSNVEIIQLQTRDTRFCRERSFAFPG